MSLRPLRYTGQGCGHNACQSIEPRRRLRAVRPCSLAFFSIFSISDEPSELDVFLIQHYREASPRIWIGRDGTNEGMYLAIADAEQLIAQLHARVDAAKG
jgi:hypothetical protein